MGVCGAAVFITDVVVRKGMYLLIYEDNQAESWGKEKEMVMQ